MFAIEFPGWRGDAADPGLRSATPAGYWPHGDSRKAIEKPSLPGGVDQGFGALGKQLLGDLNA